MQPLRHACDNEEPACEPARWRRWLALGGVLAVGAVVAAGIWLNGGWAVAPLANVGQPADLVLSASESWLMGSPSGLSVHIMGQIDGEAEVWAPNWEPQRLTGRVDYRVYHDWFAGPTCTLHYRPLGEVSGGLVVRYKFH